MKYEIREGRYTTIAIRSSGPDKIWDTEDDIGRDVPGPIPANHQEAIGLLREKLDRRKQLGLDWLLTAEVDDDHRESVVKAVKPLLKSRLKTSATRTVTRWATTDQIQQMAEANEIDSAEAVGLLAEKDDPNALLPFINDTNSTAQSGSFGDW